MWWWALESKTWESISTNAWKQKVWTIVFGHGKRKGQMNARGFKQVEGQYYNGIKLTGTGHKLLGWCWPSLLWQACWHMLWASKMGILACKIWGWGTHTHELSTGLQVACSWGQCFIIEEVPLCTEADCKCILRTDVVLCCEHHGTQTKHSISLPLVLQMGWRTTCNDDVMDQ